MPSKRFKKLPEKSKELSPEPIEKLLTELKKNCTAKFDESLDLSFLINNKQKKSEINIRTVVNLPGGTGKKIKVAVVCEDAKSQEAKDAGADIVGGDEFIEKIKTGELNFEKLICTPGMMVKLSKLGKVLGPKGLMPNPKLGSVSENIKDAVSNAKSGQVEIRNDKDGNIGVSFGKKSTGVGRPNIETETFSLDFSSSISSTIPLKEAKGPSTTWIFSPTLYSIPDFGCATPSFICPKIFSISLSETGTGIPLVPKKPLTLLIFFII
tara:strand:- start:230 stop:1030 length:801 start_codon:yes stop_codon:yes gene_type:complete